MAAHQQALNYSMPNPPPKKRKHNPLVSMFFFSGPDDIHALIYENLSSQELIKLFLLNKEIAESQYFLIANILFKRDDTVARIWQKKELIRWQQMFDQVGRHTPLPNPKLLFSLKSSEACALQKQLLLKWSNSAADQQRDSYDCGQFSRLLKPLLSRNEEDWGLEDTMNALLAIRLNQKKDVYFTDEELKLFSSIDFSNLSDELIFICKLINQTQFDTISGQIINALYRRILENKILSPFILLPQIAHRFNHQQAQKIVSFVECIIKMRSSLIGYREGESLAQLFSVLSKSGKIIDPLQAQNILGLVLQSSSLGLEPLKRVLNTLISEKQAEENKQFFINSIIALSENNDLPAILQLVHKNSHMILTAQQAKTVIGILFAHIHTADTEINMEVIKALVDYIPAMDKLTLQLFASVLFNEINIHEDVLIHINLQQLKLEQIEHDTIIIMSVLQHAILYFDDRDINNYVQRYVNKLNCELSDEIQARTLDILSFFIQVAAPAQLKNMANTACLKFLQLTDLELQEDYVKFLNDPMLLKHLDQKNLDVLIDYLLQNHQMALSNQSFCKLYFSIMNFANEKQFTALFSYLSINDSNTMDGLPLFIHNISQEQFNIVLTQINSEKDKLQFSLKYLRTHKHSKVALTTAQTILIQKLSQPEIKHDWRPVLDSLLILLELYPETGDAFKVVLDASIKSSDGVKMEKIVLCIIKQLVELQLDSSANEEESQLDITPALSM